MAQLSLDLAHEASATAETVTAPTTTPSIPVPAGDERPQSFPACLAFVSAQPDVTARSLTAFTSATKTVSKVTRVAVDALPVEPVKLRPLMRDVLPAAHGISTKRWSNIRSEIALLLRRCGWVDARNEELSLAWQVIVSHLTEKWHRSTMSNFARYCGRIRVTPTEVTADHLESYAAYLSNMTMAPKPHGKATSVKQTWNQLAAAKPDLGLPTLAMKSRAFRRARPIDDFPVSFQRELTTYIEHLRNFNPLNETGERELAPISIEHRRRDALRAATHLLDAGIELTEITGLHVLVTEAAARTVLLAIYQEAGNRWNGVALSVVNDLIAMAKHWVRVPTGELEALMALRRRIKAPGPALSRKNRDRLAQFEDPQALDELCDLPDRAFEQAEKMLHEGEPEDASALFMAGIALGILLAFPIRRRNLASVSIDKNVVCDKRGRVQRLVFAAIETKGTKDIDAHLAPEFASRFDQYLKVFRPLRPDHNANNWLFPWERGRHLSESTVAAHVTRLVESQLGARFNIHLTRHLSATLLLNANVNNLPLVQRLLGHAQPSTTYKKYGVVTTAVAQRAYEKIVDDLTTKASKRESQRKRRSK
jgi:integrase